MTVVDPNDPAVLGRTFYLMGFIDGWSPMGRQGWPAPFDHDVDARRGLAVRLGDRTPLLAHGVSPGRRPGGAALPAADGDPGWRGAARRLLAAAEGDT